MEPFLRRLVQSVSRSIDRKTNSFVSGIKFFLINNNNNKMYSIEVALGGDLVLGLGGQKIFNLGVRSKNVC